MAETTYKKKLIEVAIPLEAINKASAREKSIRHGHPNTLHLWWARRPLAACRAVLFAQLVDDPSSHPDKFPTLESQHEERERLFKIMEDLVIWENSTNEQVLSQAYREIEESCNGKPPPIYDPFSGGCSIPLEAQRLGLPAYGSDLNPVAVTIGKSMIELPIEYAGLPPMHPGQPDRGFDEYKRGEGLAEDIKYYGEELKREVYEKIGHFYPSVQLPANYGGKDATVVAYIWARAIPSPDPALGGRKVPLIKSFVLSNKKGRRVWLEPIIENGDYRFEIRKEPDVKFDAPASLVGRKGAICLVSGAAIPLDYIRECGRSGKIENVLIAKVVNDGKNTHFVEATEQPKIDTDILNNLIVPSAKIDHWAGCTNCVVYGMEDFSDLYSDRAKLSLVTFSNELDNLCNRLIEQNMNKSYVDTLRVYLSFAIDRLADALSSIATWSPGGFIKFTFSRHALPMTWDYAECNPFSNNSGNFSGALEWVSKAVSNLPLGKEGMILHSDAQSASYPPNAVISTDPPYYDNIPYSNLSDFFYIWMRKNLKGTIPELFGTLAVPKFEELVANKFRHGGDKQAEEFFMNGMKRVFANIGENASPDYPVTIYYAFKQNEIESEGLTSKGWATFVQAIISSGLQIVGTWPIRTERAARTRGIGSNALATSVVIVCRRITRSAETVTRSEFIRALKKELPEALRELQAANIAPSDVPQSSIGPGIGIFSRYEAVLESDDSPMTVKTALQVINRELDEYFSGIEGEFDTETRFAVTWFEQHGMEAGDFGVANNIAQARGISVDSVAHAGIVSSVGGKVRVLKRDEMDENWSPETDTHLTDWECCQYLIRTLENDGEFEAAILMKKMGGERAEAAKDVAYRLYDICDKKGWAKEGTSYNGLIAVWSELTSQAASLSDADMVKSGEQHSFL